MVIVAVLIIINASLGKVVIGFNLLLMIFECFLEFFVLLVILQFQGGFIDESISILFVIMVMETFIMSMSNPSTTRLGTILVILPLIRANLQVKQIPISGLITWMIGLFIGMLSGANDNFYIYGIGLLVIGWAFTRMGIEIKEREWSI